MNVLAQGEIRGRDVGRASGSVVQQVGPDGGGQQLALFQWFKKEGGTSAAAVMAFGKTSFAFGAEQGSEPADHQGQQATTSAPRQRQPAGEHATPAVPTFFPTAATEDYHTFATIGGALYLAPVFLCTACSLEGIPNHPTERACTLHDGNSRRECPKFSQYGWNVCLPPPWPTIRPDGQRIHGRATSAIRGPPSHDLFDLA